MYKVGARQGYVRAVGSGGGVWAHRECFWRADTLVGVYVKSCVAADRNVGALTGEFGGSGTMQDAPEPGRGSGLSLKRVSSMALSGWF